MQVVFYFLFFYLLKYENNHLDHIKYLKNYAHGLTWQETIPEIDVLTIFT